MNLPEDRQTKAVEDALRELKKSRALIRAHIKEGAFERITLITDVRVFQKMLFFRLDEAEILRSVVEPLEAWKLTIEFSGKDQYPSFFETTSGQVVGNVFWFQAPDRIERLQRRRNFRLKAPTGASLEVMRYRKPIRLGLIDFSLGGVLCLVDSVNPRMRRERIFKEGRTFKNARLIIPLESDPPAEIPVSKARIVRSDQNSLTGAYQYGLMFITLDSTAEKRLKDLLYRLQRAYLRKRRKLGSA